jgi:hypothetical protein
MDDDREVQPEATQDSFASRREALKRAARTAAYVAPAVALLVSGRGAKAGDGGFPLGGEVS